MLSLSKIIENGRQQADAIFKPYVIAEVGVNHEGSMDTAKMLVEQAARGGAHAVKFQTYRAETLAAKESPAYWDTSKEPTRSQFELFSKHDKFWKNEMEALRRVCESFEIDFMSTPFDYESIAFLAPLMDVFKVSSSDLTNKPLIRRICEHKKPILLSTGASELEEIERTVGWIESEAVPIALLHCVLNYPTMDEKASLGQIIGLRKAFPKLAIGYSDHTLPGNMGNLVLSTVLGATIIEKHFTHDKTLPGNDHYHAMDEKDLNVFWNEFGRVSSVVGSFKVTSLDEESISRKNARRSLVAVRDISEGEVIREDMLIPKRPESGIAAFEIDEVVGKKARLNICADSILQWDMVV